MDSGLAADDQYNLYSKPLFTDRGSNLYRPNKAQDDELHGGEGGDDKDVRSERFKPTKVSHYLPSRFRGFYQGQNRLLQHLLCSVLAMGTGRSAAFGIWVLSRQLCACTIQYPAST